MLRRGPAIVAAAAVVVLGVAAWPFTVDDAFIVARYAEHLVFGEGWAMNPGVPTDGVTAPAWVLPMAAGVASGIGPLVVAKVLGLACGAAAAAVAVQAASRRSGGHVAGRVAAAVVALSGNLAWWAVAGLETGLATLLLTVAALAAVARPRPRPVGSGVPVALLAWLRPEMALAAAMVLAAIGWRDRRAGMVALALAALGAVSVTAFRIVLFDQPLPLSFAAKPADPSEGLPYVLRGLVVITGGLGLVPAVVAAARGRRDERVLGLVVVAHVAAVVLAGGDWMPGFRLLAPVVPLWALLAGTGAARLWRSGRRGLRVLAAAAVLVACAVPALDIVAQLPAAREAGARRERVGRPLAAWLAEHARTAALVDVGYLPWASSLEVVDLGGLTDPTVARAPGGHLAKRIDPGWLAARDPDVIVLHASKRPRVDEAGRLETLAGFPVERTVAQMRWVRERYGVVRLERYAPGYWYVVLGRR